MSHRRYDWHERIKAVEREYWCASLAVSRLSQAAVRNALVLGPTLTSSDVVLTESNLTGTYLIRMFAEFESALRAFWLTIRPRSRPATLHLLNQIGGVCNVPAKIVTVTQQVRAYRNALVHELNSTATPVSMAEARSSLQHFLSRLPNEWS